MPGWDGRFSRKIAASDTPTCVISRSAASFTATGKSAKKVVVSGGLGHGAGLGGLGCSPEIFLEQAGRSLKEIV